MKIVRTMLVVVSCLSLVLLASGQDKKQPSPEEVQKMMEIYQKVATPGAHHAIFKQMEGDWNYHMKMWMDPKQPPMESEGTAKSQTLFDGRYLRSDNSGTFMGQPFNGLELLGYDNFRGEYNMTWVDNLGTGTTIARGQPDSTGKVITLTGKMDEPTTGEKDKNVKYVYRFTDPDHYTFEGYDLVGTPNEFKVMEIANTRKK